MAASKTIGGINVTISATIDKFQKAMTTARRVLSSFTKAISAAVFSVKGLATALAGGFSVAMFTKWTASAMQSIDALGELSDKLGISTEALAGYQLAAQEAGVSQETLERSLVALNKKGFGGPNGLRSWIEQTAQLSTHQEKLAAATAMFGSRGSSMVRMLTGGTAALDEAQTAAENLGLALDRASVAGVERALDAFARLRSAVGGVFRQIAVDIAPFVEVLSNKLTSFLATGGRAKGVGKTIADAIIKTAQFVADAIQTMVGGVMSFLADAKSLFHDFRDTQIAKAMGLGYKGDAAWGAGMVGVMQARDRASSFNAKLPWSASIGAAMDEARAQAAAQAATAPGNQGGALGRILSGTASGLLKDLKDLPGKMLATPQGMGLMLQFKAMQAMNFGFGAKAQLAGAGAGVQSSSAQDPLSREGFAQRVRSLQQNSLTKVANQQLVVQKQIRDAIKGQPGMAPLNLAGA